MSPSSDYDIPKPSKIKLKETKAEQANKIYRREQRRAEKDARRIARANAAYGHETYSPPKSDSTGRERERQREVDPEEGYGDDDDNNFNNYNNRAQAARGRDDLDEKMGWMAEDDYTRAFGFGNGFPFMPFMGHGPRIPQRHQRWEGPGPSRRRDAADEVRFHPGAQVPDMGHMSADEYAAFIRDGFNRRRHRQDMDDMEGRREARRTEARKLEIDEQVERERQERKAQKQKREKAVNEEENCKAERRKWRARCAALMDGEVVSVNLKFSDIPWPVYTATSSQDVSVVVTPEDLTVDKVRVFLNALATDESKGADSKSVEDSRRKVLRDAIRQFHPDRFFSRVLPRVREPDQDKVKEGVERTSRLINELFSNDK